MSMIMTEQRGFRADFCRELARVLKLPETVVLEAAGMLGPARTQEELTLRELYELMRELPTEDQRAIVAEARARYEKRKG
jgi:hypothetical protein